MADKSGTIAKEILLVITIYLPYGKIFNEKFTLHAIVIDECKVLIEM